MKKFAFRLRKVRSLRHQEVGAARLNLADAVHRLALCDERIAAMNALAEEYRQETATTSATAPLARALLRGVESAAIAAAAARTTAERAVVETRAVWLRRRTASAAIDKLYAVRHEAWQRTVAASEQGELEEAARFGRLIAERRGDSADSAASAKHEQEDIQ